jgi:hypothetical protein
MTYYVVKYSGPFGFIKPWTAVRDIETYSQQFLTPSIIEGIEKKLFPELLKYPGKILKITRHRLSYCELNLQQERTWSKGIFEEERKTDDLRRIYYISRNPGIITRGVMINPHLHLAFLNEDDARKAFTQTICLCRNEDLLFPEELTKYSEEKFEGIAGFELIPSTSEFGFKVGNNRFNETEMYGELKIFGEPIRQE